MRSIGGTILIASSFLLGCQMQPQVETIPEAPITQACPVPAPQIIEVPVPVPVPVACPVQPEVRQGKKARPAQKPSINSVQEHLYMPGALYPTYVAVNNATTILLQSGEYLNQAVIGDKGKWSTSEIAAGSSAGDRGGLVLNCTEVGARSNLTIAASKRVYLLDLRCTESTYNALVSWTYPEERGVGILNGTKPAPQPQPVLTVPDAPSTARYTLRSNRAIAWMPTHVYDTGVQGKQTYIVFPPELGVTDAPVLYVRTVEGTQAIVNYRTLQGFWLNDRIYNAEALQGKLSLGAPVTYYILDQIADHLELRVGEKKPTIVKITRHLPEV